MISHFFQGDDELTYEHLKAQFEERRLFLTTTVFFMKHLPALAVEASESQSSKGVHFHAEEKDEELPDLHAGKVAVARSGVLNNGEQFTVVCARRHEVGRAAVQFINPRTKKVWGEFGACTVHPDKMAPFEGAAVFGNLVAVLAIAMGSEQAMRAMPIHQLGINVRGSQFDLSPLIDGQSGWPVLYIFDTSKFPEIPTCGQPLQLEPVGHVLLSSWSGALHVDLVPVRLGDSGAELKAVVSSGFNFYKGDVGNVAQMAIVTVGYSVDMGDFRPTSSSKMHSENAKFHFDFQAGVPEYIPLRDNKMNMNILPYNPEGTLIVPHADKQGFVVFSSGVNSGMNNDAFAVIYRNDSDPRVVKLPGTKGVCQFVGRTFRRDGVDYLVVADFCLRGAVLLYKVVFDFDGITPLIAPVAKDQIPLVNLPKFVMKFIQNGRKPGANRVHINELENGDIWATVVFKDGQLRFYKVYEAHSKWVGLHFQEGNRLHFTSTEKKDELPQYIKHMVKPIRKKIQPFMYEVVVCGMKQSTDKDIVVDLLVPFYNWDGPALPVTFHLRNKMIKRPALTSVVVAQSD